MGRWRKQAIESRKKSMRSRDQTCVLSIFSSGHTWSKYVRKYTVPWSNRISCVVSVSVYFITKLLYTVVTLTF